MTELSAILLLSGTALLAAGALLVPPAAAEIRCKGPAQVLTGGNLHNTPYCEDRYLYEVATGSYGVRTSFNTIRFNDNAKERVCQVVGHDARVWRR